MDQHIRQGHKKLPIVLPICLYHGLESPYPYPLDIYQCFDIPDLAKQVAFKPFMLLDLTILSDDELAKDGLAFLMEMLLKHSRTKNFLTILKQRRETIKEILKQLNKESRQFMVKYVINETQDENEPDAVEQLVQILTADLPEDKEIIMTFAQQLKQQGREEGRYEVAKNLLAEGMSIELVKKVTKLPDLDLIELEKA